MLYRLGVNVSARQFHQRDFLGMIDRVLADTKLGTEWLELEITETMAMQKSDRTISILHAVRDRGIGIALDDFGTGQSSLTYLKRFPISTVKIIAVVFTVSISEERSSSPGVLRFTSPSTKAPQAPTLAASVGENQPT